MREKLADALVELDEELVETTVKELRNQGVAPLDILAQLQKGMEEVGRRFESNVYFLSELIMSGDIFKTAASLLGDAFKSNESASLGTVVMGTVKDDVHDIGKDIVITLMSCNGFKVIDLGVDVPAENFIAAIKEHDPQIIGMSCLLTSAFDSMKSTISSIEAAGLRENRKILIGGGPVDQRVVEYVNADAFATNAQEAIDLCKKIVEK